MLDLSVELVERILEFCPPKDLLAMTCVSSGASGIALPVLYRHPQVNGANQDGLKLALQAQSARRGWLVSLTLVEHAPPSPEVVQDLVSIFVSPTDFRRLRSVRLLPYFSHPVLSSLLDPLRDLPALQAIHTTRICFDAETPSPAVVMPGIKTISIETDGCTTEQDVLLSICASFPSAISIAFDTSHAPPYFSKAGLDALQRMPRLQTVNFASPCDMSDLWAQLHEHLPRTLSTFTITIHLEYACKVDHCPWSHLMEPVRIVTDIGIPKAEGAFALAMADAINRGTFPNLRSVRVETALEVSQTADPGRETLERALRDVGLHFKETEERAGERPKTRWERLEDSSTELPLKCQLVCDGSRPDHGGV